MNRSLEQEITSDIIIEFGLRQTPWTIAKKSAKICGLFFCGISGKKILTTLPCVRVDAVEKEFKKKEFHGDTFLNQPTLFYSVDNSVSQSISKEHKEPQRDLGLD